MLFPTPLFSRVRARHSIPQIQHPSPRQERAIFLLFVSCCLLRVRSGTQFPVFQFSGKFLFQELEKHHIYTILRKLKKFIPDCALWGFWTQGVDLWEPCRFGWEESCEMRKGKPAVYTKNGSVVWVHVWVVSNNLKRVAGCPMSKAAQKSRKTRRLMWLLLRVLLLKFNPRPPLQAAPQLTPAGPPEVVQLLERVGKNDKAHEFLVAVLLLLECWNVRATGSCRALRFWGGPPAPSAPLQAEQGPCTAHHAAWLTGMSCKGLWGGCNTSTSRHKADGPGRWWLHQPATLHLELQRGVADPQDLLLTIAISGPRSVSNGFPVFVKQASAAPFKNIIYNIMRNPYDNITLYNIV
jgi:hypothetical protein